MLYKLLVMLHLLGASVWIGGHVVLDRVILPKALRERDPRPLLEFERGYGRVGLLALAIQLATGLWLAHIWLGGWSHILKDPPPAATYILIKLGLAAATVVLAGHAYHRVLPR